MVVKASNGIAAIGLDWSGLYQCLPVNGNANGRLSCGRRQSVLPARASVVLGRKSGSQLPESLARLKLDIGRYRWDFGGGIDLGDLSMEMPTS
jgi:hypothetical protein